ncbi:NAD(P)H-binding protein [Aquabacterium sp. OR-4]|uniref:NAD(P)H-binding protein n=1 Tax=Aquabacterium sp. OR-4 TaxID=2978127 RepID=UPI0021B3F351|nr:NAD(P)H-binding protein [Aquabacterium sp. OR-4]MDT7836860.1 NAD(P)H-binding protein [Aquabacterium sp. OR-4]
MNRHPSSALRRVAVAGASGLVGRALLQALAADPAVTAVHAVLRRAPAAGVMPDTKTRALFADPARLGQPGGPVLPDIDAAFCALGTTIKTAGSQAAFRAVDLDAVLSFAQAARAAGAQRLGLVSALGAEAGSAVFYNRIKGEAEAALIAMDWPRLVIARPSLLLGDRAALGQPVRAGEQIAQRLAPAIGWLLPRRLRPIPADCVARALHRALASNGPAVQILESDALRALGD